jgi:regulator of protease activity HflC (stomatin/prohibitin superfamily)
VRERRATTIVILLTALLIAAFFFNDIFIRIKSGEAGVLYRTFLGGTVTDRVYGEGLHVIFPWDRMYIYSVRLQRVTQEVEVLTEKGLKVHISVAIRFHPEHHLLGVLHQQLGPDYVHTVVVPEVEATLLRILGNYDVEEVYRSQRAINATIINAALEKVAHDYVTIDDVLVRHIRLPERVQNAIEMKIEQQHLFLAYEFRLKREDAEKQRKEIESAGIKTYNDTVGASLNDRVLKWHGIEATKEMAASPNAKVIVMGNGDKGLPVVLSAGEVGAK